MCAAREFEPCWMQCSNALSSSGIPSLQCSGTEVYQTPWIKNEEPWCYQGFMVWDSIPCLLTWWRLNGFFHLALLLFGRILWKLLDTLWALVGEGILSTWVLKNKDWTGKQAEGLAAPGVPPSIQISSSLPCGAKSKRPQQSKKRRLFKNHVSILSQFRV